MQSSVGMTTVGYDARGQVVHGNVPGAGMAGNSPRTLFDRRYGYGAAHNVVSIELVDGETQQFCYEAWDRLVWA